MFHSARIFGSNINCKLSKYQTSILFPRTRSLGLNSTKLDTILLIHHSHFHLLLSYYKNINFFSSNIHNLFEKTPSDFFVASDENHCYLIPSQLCVDEQANSCHTHITELRFDPATKECICALEFPVKIYYILLIFKIIYWVYACQELEN